ncbi:MAG TPA: cytochrome c, partial [Alphaproteobacteria bacterium]|nr:cytochrome c [Alphaproteobacteria bacterium]
MWKTASLVAALYFAAASTLAASPPETIAKGEYLARAGDCVVCHTGAGEKPFAGGLKMATPLGEIYTTNITPDK